MTHGPKLSVSAKSIRPLLHPLAESGTLESPFHSLPRFCSSRLDPHSSSPLSSSSAAAAAAAASSSSSLPSSHIDMCRASLPSIPLRVGHASNPTTLLTPTPSSLLHGTLLSSIPFLAALYILLYPPHRVAHLTLLAFTCALSCLSHVLNPPCNFILFSLRTAATPCGSTMANQIVSHEDDMVNRSRPH
ncbi:unnamed protein product [Periconia digitata]|uniref:Uncharacterized protein n=1 Tax=Periconia digitata TaxID=1303443 RepID=A0A9W4UF13_9PLEO|nr:unnamed protein product [Periconia digitata]